MHIASAYRNLRVLLMEHDDLPAFQAGTFVLTFVVAALFPLGGSLIIIAFTGALFFFEERCNKAQCRVSAYRVLRFVLSDLALLFFALAALILTRPLLESAQSGTMHLVRLTLLGGALSLAAKTIILEHFLSTLCALPVGFASFVRARISALGPTRYRIWIGLMAFSLLLSVLAVPMFHYEADAVVRVLIQEFALWR